jgi:putative hydrolase of the HAD superfamily
MAIFIDGDDTLWGMQSVYFEARDLLVDFCRKRGVPHEYAVERFTEIDMERTKRNGGFDRLEFHLSILGAAKEFATEYGFELTLQDRKYLQFIGTAPYQSKPELIPQSQGTVLDALEKLKQLDRLILYTAGRPDVQWRKADRAGVLSFFDNYVVLPNKNTLLLRGLLETYNLRPEGTTVIGNSLRSDIYPAIGCGCGAIYIPNGGWEYDKTARFDGYVQLKEFREVEATLVSAKRA